jgi:hypothetical protein
MESHSDNTRIGNQNWLWGGLLVALGIVFLLGQFLDLMAGFIWAAVFVGFGLVFFAVSRREPKQWWALIPAYAMWCVAALIVMGTMGIPGEIIGSFVMFAIAFPFLYVYFRNREHWWALIPAYVMVAIGVLILLTVVLSGELIASYVMFAIAFPFLYVYLHHREHWWALIPGGIMAVIGIGLMIGAIVPFIPVLLIVGGVYLLVSQIAGREKKAAPQTPKTGPEADKPAG